jgi:hypothetical protein
LAINLVNSGSIAGFAPDRSASPDQRETSCNEQPSLRVRLQLEQVPGKDYRTRLVAAESELARRQSRRRIDWDEPTDTDVERLRGKLRAVGAVAHGM